MSGSLWARQSVAIRETMFTCYLTGLTGYMCYSIIDIYSFADSLIYSFVWISVF